MSNTDDWAYIWICHFLKHAKPVDTLPLGWCVYREALDWDQLCGEFSETREIGLKVCGAYMNFIESSYISTKKLQNY